MKSLRLLVVLMAVGAVSLFPARAHAQQEVDPDHFDQPTTNVAHSKAHNSKLASVHHPSQANARIASRHGGSKGHHRSGRAVA
jgi:hypothetical protein